MTRWTRWAGFGGVLLALTGCVAGYGMSSLSARHSLTSRPHPSYYCYDCHGDRFFDPYYDWCVNYGFRYSWASRPEVTRLYRERYLRIKERHPEYGRYRYRSDYRETRRYREPADYEAWLERGRGDPGQSERRTERTRQREKKPNDAGTTKTKDRERKEPPGSKPRDSLREGVSR